MMRRMKLGIWAGILVLLLGMAPLHGQQKLLSVNMETQQMDQWCWVASSQCLVRQRTGNYFSQEAYVRYIKGSIVNQPGTGDEIERACRGGGATVSQTGPLSMSGIQSLINANKCFIVGRQGHATVGFGYYYQSYVAIADPWPGMGSSWYTMSNLQNGWFMTVR